MSKKTDNFKLYKYEDSDLCDLRFLHDSMNTIDKGLILDVGTSTGTGNDYVLNLGSITLSSANKGISFKFWADKDSNGAATINGTYNLIKANGNPVKNIKANVPYTITYDGNTSFFLSSGGSDESDSTTVGIDGSKVLAGETFIGSDGEVHAGQIPIRTAVNTTLKAGQSVSLESGYYKDKSTIKAETLSTALTNAGTTLTNPSQLISGVKAVDKNGKLITGTATIQSLGGKQYFSNYYTNTILTDDRHSLYIPISNLNIPFTPSVIKGYLRSGNAGNYDYKGFSITSGTTDGTGWGINSYYTNESRKYTGYQYYNMSSVTTRIEVYTIRYADESAAQVINKINEIFIEAYS